MAQHKKLVKAKDGAWFIPLRGSYLPASPAGWLSYIPFIGYMVFACIYGLRETKDWPAAILFILANWIAATALMTLIAERKS